MSLSEIISNMNLNLWAELAMVIFMSVFIAVVYRVWKLPSDEIERCRQIPLSEEPVETRHA